MNLDKLLDLFRKFNAEYFESQLQISSIEYKKDFKDGRMGHYDSKDNRIQIGVGLCDSQERITLLHEMIHMRINGHGVDFQDELDRCAKESSGDFRKEILSELERIQDNDRFDYMNRYDWIEGQFKVLAIEMPGRSWVEIKQCGFEASHLNDSEFAENEEWLSATWNYWCGLSNDRPPIPAIGKQNNID